MTTKRPFLAWQAREKVLLGICGVIIALGGAWVVIKGAAKSADAACIQKVCNIEFMMFDTLHAPLKADIAELKEQQLATTETMDKVFYLVKSQMTSDQVETALRARDIDRGVRGPSRFERSQ